MRNLILCLVLTISALSFAGKKVVFVTNYGDITIELFEKQAPITTTNFLNYVKKGFYQGLIFHRVIKDFVIQGGGFKPGMKSVPVDKPIKNEANNGLSNVKGTLAMARTNNPHSATSQFFINVKDNTFLDYKHPANPGYCVFATIIQGMDVVNRIRMVETKTVGMYRDVPSLPVIIREANIIE